jgi:hypothetical protein
MPTYMPITEVDELDELRREIDVRLGELYDQAFEAKNIKITIPAANHDGPSTVRLTVQEVLAPLYGNASATSSSGNLLDGDEVMGGEKWTDLTDGGDTTLHIHEIYAEHAAVEDISGAWDFTTMPVMSAGLHLTGWTTPTSGVGVELGWVTGGTDIGRLISYDRDASQYKPFYLYAAPFRVYNNAVPIAEFKATSLDVEKHLYVNNGQHLYLSGGGDINLENGSLVGIPGHGQILFATAAPKISMNLGLTLGGDLAMAGNSITGLSTTGQVQGTATEYLSFDAAGKVDLHLAVGGELRVWDGPEEMFNLSYNTATNQTTWRYPGSSMAIRRGAASLIASATSGNSWIFYCLNGQPVRLRYDNQHLQFGDGTDAAIYYDATNLIVDPDVAGAGAVHIGASGEDTIMAGRYNVKDTGTYIYQRADGYLSIIGDTAIELGDQTTGNYTCVETDGTVVSYGDATTHDDIYIGFSSARVPAANAPNWESFIGNLNAYTFAVNDYLELDPVELEHTYLEDSNFELHVHWATNGTEGGAAYVKWEIEYTIANSDLTGGVGDTFPATTVVSAETEIPAATADLANMYTSVATVTGTNFNIGAILKVRVRRIASAGDAPAANPFGLMVGVHIEKDTKGSRTISAK